MGGKSDAEVNKEAVLETNKTNKEIANQNLGYQYENLEYQKALQQTTFQREDTANQRAVNDMRSAGLSPLSQFNNPSAAGAVIPTEAPQNGYQHQTYNSTRQAERIANLQLANSIINSAADMQNKQYQNAMLEEELRSKKMQNNVYEQTQQDTINRTKVAALMENEALRKRLYDRRYQEYYGIHDSDSFEERLVKFLGHQKGDKSYSDLELGGQVFKDMPSARVLDGKSIYDALKEYLPDNVRGPLAELYEDSSSGALSSSQKVSKVKAFISDWNKKHPEHKLNIMDYYADKLRPDNEKQFIFNSDGSVTFKDTYRKTHSK